jgi:hypothetical protein
MKISIRCIGDGQVKLMLLGAQQAASEFVASTTTHTHCKLHDLVYIKVDFDSTQRCMQLYQLLLIIDHMARNEKSLCTSERCKQPEHFTVHIFLL